jgi:hypothetical protein
MSRNPFAGYDQWKTASPYDDEPEFVCRHCETFKQLGFKCSMATHLECDCPICQGLCECGDLGTPEDVDT